MLQDFKNARRRLALMVIAGISVLQILNAGILICKNYSEHVQHSEPMQISQIDTKIKQL